ncbi:MAG: hypothetical protein ACYDHY_06415 [Acidiferrobacterales bacterium]
MKVHIAQSGEEKVTHCGISTDEVPFLPESVGMQCSKEEDMCKNCTRGIIAEPDVIFVTDDMIVRDDSLAEMEFFLQAA